MDVLLVPNQSEKGKYNLISGCFNKISKRFICVNVTKVDIGEVGNAAENCSKGHHLLYEYLFAYREKVIITFIEVKA